MSGTCTLNGIALPLDIEWQDEGAWMPTAQVVTTTITGAQIVQASAVQAGRPITLVARGDQHVWLSYAEVKTLRALAESNLSTPMALVLLDGRAFTVIWRHQDTAIEFEPVRYSISTDSGVNDARPYILTLRLMQV